MSLNKSDEYVQAAVRIVENAKSEGIPLRVLGACAIRIQCAESRHVLDEMQRSISDLDFISYGKYEHKITPFFTKLGYKVDSEVSKYYAHLYGMLRDRFKDPNNGSTLDVFYDRLEMCHTVDLTKRLEIDFPTISLTDLLLEKMQIVQINKKDLDDMVVLLMSHPVSESDQNSVNRKYLADVLSEDWGFYYTVTTNLQKLKQYAGDYTARTGTTDSVSKKIDELLQSIEAHPKGFKWKMRAKVGNRQKWYNDVDEVSMGAGPPAK